MQKSKRSRFSLSAPNIIGLILLLPICTVFCIDLIARIVQGDLTRYNRPVYALLSHSPLYYFPVLFTWVILFPLLAVLINVTALIKNMNKQKTSFFSLAFLTRNIGAIIIFVISLGFLAILKLHDFAPCFIRGLQIVGIGHLSKILEVCRRA